MPPPTGGGGTALEATEAADAAYNAAARAAAALPPDELLAGVGDAFRCPDAPCACTLTVSRDPLCVGGWYTKDLRGLSQSPWLADGGDVGDGSVAADIEAVVLPLLRADSAKVRTARPGARQTCVTSIMSDVAAARRSSRAPVARTWTCGC